uniref:Peptidase A1 domain-containing protein n=1 Tax=Strongyloides papillosus TaxID=174720 RepID=A0A0N5BHP0_STREA
INYVLPIDEDICEFGLFSLEGITFGPTWILGDICEFGLFSLEGMTFGPTWILGDPFIRSYCQIHNFVDKSIGFAKPKILI